jgi:hypothetical protein
LLWRQLGADGEHGLQSMVQHFCLKVLHLYPRRLDGRRIGRRLIEQTLELPASSHQILMVYPSRRALRAQQGTDVSRLLVRQTQAFLGPMPKDLPHRCPILRREKRLSAGRRPRRT